MSARVHKIYLVSQDAVHSTYNEQTAMRLKLDGFRRVTSHQYQMAAKVCKVMRVLRAAHHVASAPAAQQMRMF